MTETHLKNIARLAQEQALKDHMIDERQGGMQAAKAQGIEPYSASANIFCTLYNSNMDRMEALQRSMEESL